MSLSLPWTKKMECNILVIDGNNSPLQRGIISSLIKDGFTVTTRESLHEALTALVEFKPHMVILGEKLPIISYEACYYLRQAVDVPILMVGSVNGGEVWTEMVEAGADFYLVTPFSYAELLSRVKVLLRRFKQTQSKNGREPAFH